MKTNILSLEEIREKLNNKEYETKLEYTRYKMYKENHIFDEEKSVKWNREEVIRQNKLTKEKYDEYTEDVCRLHNEFQEDVISYIMDYLDMDNKKIAEIIYNKAYSDGHSYGMYEVLIHVDNLVDMQYEIFKEYKK